jgi:hypothetical protein
MKAKFFGNAIVFMFFAATWASASIAVTACTKTAFNAAVNAAGQVCEVVFQALDPALAPLCTTAADVAQAIAAIVGTQADGGTGVASMSAAQVNSQVYAWLLSHGAQPLK